MTFRQDIVALSKAFGHSKPETTMEHYVFPKESIGLTQRMINQNISIDEFIFNQSKNQTTINQWSHQDEIKPVLPTGQRTINDYTFNPIKISTRTTKAVAAKIIRN